MIPRGEGLSIRIFYIGLLDHIVNEKSILPLLKSLRKEWEEHVLRKIPGRVDNRWVLHDAG